MENLNQLTPFFLKIKIEKIMNDFKINKSFVFRDKYQVCYIDFRPLNTAQELIGRNSYLGEFTIE
jgi:hypothetical protein